MAVRKLQESRVFQAQVAELDRMMVWVREVLKKVKLQSSRCRKFEIAIEEALINIINYAYPNYEGLIKIIYEKDEKKETVNFSIIDQGNPFNPIKDVKKPNIGTKVEEQPIGGLGIHFMRELTDHIDYRREGNSNILILSQQINK